MSCPDCFRGGVSAGTPTGTVTTIHGIPTYVAEPEDGVTPKGIIVIITDAFGWEFVNNRVLSDVYAKKGGFLVYCPDFMDGNAMDSAAIGIMDRLLEPSTWLETFSKPLYVYQAMRIGLPWKNKTAIPITLPRVVAFFQALRTSAPPFATDSLKIGAAGFCWGGKHTVLLAQDSPSTRVQRHESQAKKSAEPEPLIDCAFTAHPSYIEVPVDIEAITVPISVAIGDKDKVMKASVAEKMKEILDSKKAGHEVTILPGAKHGFAIRTHPDNKHEMECAEKAEAQAIKWFTKSFT